MTSAMRFEVYVDKRMPVPLKGQVTRQTNMCNKRTILLGLMGIVVFCTLALCQVMNSRYNFPFAVEPIPQEQFISEGVHTRANHMSFHHRPKMITTIMKYSPVKDTLKKAAATKSQNKAKKKKKTKGKGITSNVIIEGQDDVRTHTQKTKNGIDTVKVNVNGKADQERTKSTLQENTKLSRLSTMRPRKKSSALNNQKCPDVLRLSSVGKWVKRKTSKAELSYMEKFLTDSRKQLHIPASLSRSDGRCGNIGLPGLAYTRALCDPKGNTPCCHDNTCKALSVDKCRCDNCYDMRQRIHAEHATWTPADKRCKLKNFTASEACDILSGSQIYLIGDSYMRHLYSAFLMVVKNDGRFGALKSRLSEGDRTRCEGIYSFGSKECRPMLEPKPGALCNGTFKLMYISHSKSVWAPQFLQLVNQTLKKEKTILVPGLGVHENCNATKTKQYLEKGIKLLKSQRAKWPKVVWATTHAPGLMKSPTFARQEFHQVEDFNKKMMQYLNPLRIPVFDTFNMTSQTVSFDGSHYGLGVNIAKVQLFLNYLQDLRGRRQW